MKLDINKLEEVMKVKWSDDGGKGLNEQFTVNWKWSGEEKQEEGK